MQLRVTEGGSWEISGVSEIECLFLKRVVASADTEGCEAARGRIYPGGPVESKDASDTEGSERDWSEYVIPDLKQSFGTALDVLSKDIENADSEAGDDGELSYRIPVPADHTDQWYSALNQARLVLATRYDLPITDAELVEPESIDERWIAMAQSDLYAFVQSFLLETVMKLP